MRSTILNLLAVAPLALALPQAHLPVQAAPAPADTTTTDKRQAQLPEGIVEYTTDSIDVAEGQGGQANPDVQVKSGDIIPNSWIVTLNADSLVAHSVDAIVSAVGIDTTFTYDFPGFKGFAFKGPQADVDKINDLFSSILTINPETVVTTQALLTQPNAPWGLARVSHREKGAPNYVFEENPGQGTYAYMVDTGINTGHLDFGNRAIMGVNYIADGKNYDCNGHGTHTAGIVGGDTYGVAKNTNLIGVKVFGCDGSTGGSAIIKGIDFAVNDARNNNRIDHSVINLSLGVNGVASDLDNAVQAAVNAGMFCAVAAGNNNVDVKGQSPARVVDACTVGATDANDVRAGFSNYDTDGSNDFDLWAPGVNIPSTWIGSNTATQVLSGTSMAAPHVAGLALYRIGNGGAAPPVNLCYFLRLDATKDHISDTRGAYNFLAYNNNGNDYRG